MDRILQWIERNKMRGYTLCMAGERHFCRLQCLIIWDVPKDWPIDNGQYMMIDAIGYGATEKEAIDESFRQLPT